jgi:hypothetical protein
MKSEASSRPWMLLSMFILCILLAGEAYPQVSSPSWTGVKVPQEGFAPPGDEPVGLAWGGNNQEQFFWVADRATKTIYQLTKDGTHVSDFFLGHDAEIGPIAWDNVLDGLWVIDQHDWSIRLVRRGGVTGQYRLRLPKTGLARAYPITGLTCESDCQYLWLCDAASSCTKLWRIENPRITLERDPNREYVRVEVDVFPTTDPRGLAWESATSISIEGGCLWSVAYNAGRMPSRQTVRAACEVEGQIEPNALVNSLMILEMVPWRRPSALTIKDGQIWAAFEAEPRVAQPALIVPLRTLPGPCNCE